MSPVNPTATRTSNNCSSSGNSIHEFVALQKELLELELKSENEEAINNSSSTDESSSSRRSVLRNLEVSDISVGLYGRTVVRLTCVSQQQQQKQKQQQQQHQNAGSSGSSSSRGKSDDIALLPAHRFTVGDDVEIHSKEQQQRQKEKNEQKQHAATKRRNNRTPGGVISAVTDTSISVALFQNNNKSAGGKGVGGGGGKMEKSKNSTTTEEEEDESSSIFGHSPLTLIPKSSIEVHEKIIRSLDELDKFGLDHPIAGRVVDALFHAKPQQNNNRMSGTTSLMSPTRIQPFNPNLDDSQLEAIEFALQPHNTVALCHGPPGTGKTTTVVELIHQAVHNHKMKVLVTAPSNVAVDNILERLAEVRTATKSSRKLSKRKNTTATTATTVPPQPLKVVRLGHPARMKSSIVSHSLEALVQSSEGTQIVADVRNELQSFLRILSNPKSRPNDKRLAYREMKGLRKEIRVREEKVVKELLSQAQVVFATTVGAASKLLHRQQQQQQQQNHAAAAGFDLVIIDEAAQALEASCWIPILRGKKIVMAGDHCQLPPTIMSQLPKVKHGLGYTLFQRIMDLYGDTNHNNDNSNRTKTDKDKNDTSIMNAAPTLGRVSRMLKVQYRMHETIANWASNAMYGGQLQTHESVKSRTLSQLLQLDNKHNNHATASTTTTATNKSDNNDIKNDDDDENDNIAHQSLLLIDTAGCGFYEEENTSTGSKYNSGEVEIVVQHVQQLLKLGLKQNQIAIITPYNGQVEVLRNALLPEIAPQLEIRSVDGFQGGEREAVILSLVRSSDTASASNSSVIGFLRDDRRLNVAITRAKRHCAIICDSDTCSKSKFIKGLLSYIEEYGEQRSAMEYMADNDSQTTAFNAQALLLANNIMTSATTKGKHKKEKLTKEQLEEENKIKRKALLDKISTFLQNASPGEEMIFSTELTSFDRRLVHEFAEQIGLEHRSEGTEHIDRRIILTVPTAGGATATAAAAEQAAISSSSTAAAAAAAAAAVGGGVTVPITENNNQNSQPTPTVTTTATTLHIADDNNDNSMGQNPNTATATSTVASSFAALALESDDDDDNDNDDNQKETAVADDTATIPQPKQEQEDDKNVLSMNKMLGVLAEERHLRQKQQQQQQQQQQKKQKQTPYSNKNNNNNNSGGRKLGGNNKKKKKNNDDKEFDQSLEGLDDMAFLDAQIERVQTSHGRTVAGTGNNYRSVINGILISKPPPREEKKNTNASQALQARLKKAQNDRKKKKKK